MKMALKRDAWGLALKFIREGQLDEARIKINKTWK